MISWADNQPAGNLFDCRSDILSTYWFIKKISWSEGSEQDEITPPCSHLFLSPFCEWLLTLLTLLLGCDRPWLDLWPLTDHLDQISDLLERARGETLCRVQGAGALFTHFSVYGWERTHVCGVNAPSLCSGAFRCRSQVTRSRRIQMCCGSCSLQDPAGQTRVSVRLCSLWLIIVGTLGRRTLSRCSETSVQAALQTQRPSVRVSHEASSRPLRADPLSRCTGSFGVNAQNSWIADIDVLYV